MTVPKTKLSALALTMALAVTPVHLSAQSDRQDQVILIADSVFLQGNNLLTARGNVEAIYGETTMTADQIIYDGQNDQIKIEGPIEITDATGVQIGRAHV